MGKVQDLYTASGFGYLQRSAKERDFLEGTATATWTTKVLMPKRIVRELTARRVTAGTECDESHEF